MSDVQNDLNEAIRESVPVDALTYHPVERRYRNVQMILTALLYLFIGACALFLLLLENPLWCIIAEGALAVTLGINLFILRKAWERKGYALREQDISYRSGVVFPSVTTIPYSRIQQVSVRQNPVSKMFGLYSVEVANGAQALASITIHGLNKEDASMINETLLNMLRDETD